MAKTVGDLLIKLKAEGLDSLTALKSALKGLGKASLSSDKQLESFRKEVIQVAKATKVSQQSIRGQIDAFKGLKQQATIGSTVYRKLGKDIDSLTESLDKLNRKEEEAAKKPRTAKQIFGEGVAVVPEKFSRQIAAGNELLQKLGVTSNEYATQLAAVTARTQEFSRAQQRQQVVAQNLVATNRAQTTGFLQSTKVNIENTHTTAALKQKIAELAQDIDNIDVGSKEYITTSNRLKEAQEELNQVLGISSAAFDELSRAQERAERRAAKLAGIQAAQAGQAGARNPRTGAPMAARDPNTGVMIAGGSAVSAIPTAVPELSSLYKTITQIETAGVDATLDRMGKSYQQVTKDIRSATVASNGSINSLQAQRNAFAQLRAGLDPTSQDFRELGKEIEKVDRRLEKLNKRRRRPTIGGIAQGLGGIAAGGVFGGPEGALGAAVGGAVGGVAGVAAGAAIGAQVKMVREALGATSDYAAQLQKLEIALKGVTRVTDKFGNVDSASSLGNYQLGIKAAADVTRDFNIPLDVSTKGITRLAAAVIGAGGNIGDAEVVFRNITSAIKATGGGAQDVDSAITAMVQTFSKGKVSAEELSGQLGERLPGAVTKFAEANNMTLPELQKAFKAGTVGLDQLMKFIVSLGPEYEETARAIADSSADAGAKAAVAFDQVRREIGEALQPIGAQLQKAFSKFLLDTLPAIKRLAVLAANGLNLLLDVSSFLIANFKELLIVAGAAGVALALQNLTTIGVKLVIVLSKATVAMKGFTVASLLNPWVALAAGITAATVALVKHSKKNAEFNKSVIAGETTNEEANDRLREMNDKVQELEDRLGKETNNRMIKALTRQLKAAKIAAGDLELAMKLASSYEVAGIKYDRMSGRPINAPTSYTPTDYADPDADPSGSESAPMSDAELKIRRQIRDAIAQENELLKAQLQRDLDILIAKQETEDINKRNNDIEQAKADFKLAEKKINDDINKQLEEQGKLIQQAGRELADARNAVQLLSQEERQRIEINRQLADFAEKYAEAMSSEELANALRELRANLEEANSASFKFRQGLREVFDEAMNVAEAVGKVGVDAVNDLGDAFADFVTTGKANFRDFANSVIRDLARIFAKKALFQGLSLIPGVGSFLGLAGAVSGGSGAASTGFSKTGFYDPITGKGTAGPNFGLANGAAFVKNKIVPYATGGIVNKPTLFPMANGTGLMGEAGPEAIMPLRRGANGKLGVEASGSGIGNITVNVDASGSSVEGDASEAAQLGKMLGAAVQAELVKQKRPGGLLAS